MTRDREHRETLGPFPDWHRDNLPSWYTCMDIDYTGYIDPYEWPEYAYEPYVFIELIHVANLNNWGENVLEQYPLHEHKKQFYFNIQKRTEIPVYVLWHPTDCSECIVKRIGNHNELSTHCEDKHEFCNFLDEMRQKRIKELRATELDGKA